MALKFDNRENLKGRNGLHAFIAGVSYYRHLQGGSGRIATESYGLNQLSAAATSAYKVYEWLKTRAAHLACPLATVRLLLSPSIHESALNDITEPCTWANFAEEAHQWRDAASLNINDATFFYFAGHGIIRNRRDSVLLCEDFAEPRRGPLPWVVELDNLLDGMAPPADPQKQRANQQFYFIDACREFPEPLANFKDIPPINPIFGNELPGPERNRVAPIFHAAASGTQAYSVAGEQTLFSMALLNCLDGLGGEAMREDDEGRKRWHVSVHTLSRALAFRLRELNSRYKTDQDYEPVGIFREATIHYLDGPPKVEGTLRVVPQAAVPFVAVDVMDSKSETVWQLSPEEPHPYRGTLTAGHYVVRSTVLRPPQPPYVNTVSDWNSVEPPTFTLRAQAVNDNT